MDHLIGRQRHGSSVAVLADALIGNLIKQAVDSVDCFCFLFAWAASRSISCEK